MPILDIIDYAEDKKAFIDQFTDLCLQKTFVDWLKSLPAEKQKQIKKELEGKGKAESVVAMQQYLEPQVYSDILGKVSTEVFDGYITAITPTLTQSQKEKLQKYLSSFSSKQQNT